MADAGEGLLGPDGAITIWLSAPELAHLQAQARAAGLPVEAYAERLIREAHRQLSEAALALPGAPPAH